MDEKKMIPLFDPNDRGGNSKSHLNPKIFHIVIGDDIDPLMLRALLNKQISRGVLLEHLEDRPIVMGKCVHDRLIELVKRDRGGLRFGTVHDIIGPDIAERDNFVEHGPKRGAFDRTGESPAKSLKKKRKWWER